MWPRLARSKHCAHTHTHTPGHDQRVHSAWRNPWHLLQRHELFLSGRIFIHTTALVCTRHFHITVAGTITSTIAGTTSYCSTSTTSATAA